MLISSCSTCRRLLCGHIQLSSATMGIYASRASSDEKALQQRSNDGIRVGLQLHTNNLRQGVALYRNASSKLIQTKWTDALNFYESFTHMDEVREAHDKVITIQSQLLEAQQRRSRLMIDLTAVRKEQQMIQDELANCSRSADRYLGLVRLEIDARKAEQAKILEFQNEDQNERNLFTHLTATVTASHEKEKIYANTVKYWSILLSILGAVVGVAGTSVSYYYRQNTLKDLTAGYTRQIASLHEQFDEMQVEFGQLSHEIKLARLSMNRTEERMIRNKTAASTTESWGTYLARPFKAVIYAIWSTGSSQETQRNNRK